MKEEWRRCRLREQMSSEGSERAARPAFVRPLSPRRDNEGRSSGKDVQSSLTVCVPSELRPVSSVTIQLPGPRRPATVITVIISACVREGVGTRARTHTLTCLQMNTCGSGPFFSSSAKC